MVVLFEPDSRLYPKELPIKLNQCMVDVMGMNDEYGILKIEINDQNKKEWGKITNDLKTSVLSLIYNGAKKPKCEEA